MKHSAMLHADLDAPAAPGSYGAMPTPMANSAPPTGHAALSSSNRFPTMLRLLLRSQLLRHAERQELTSDRHLLRRLTPFLPHLDMETLHRGLGLMMEEDARASRPFLAALVCEQRGQRPWAGFSRANRRLGVTAFAERPYDTSEGEWRRAVDRAYRFYGRDRPLSRC